MIARVLLPLLFAALALAAPAAAQTFNAQEQAEIRALVRNYLVNNPDVLREALDAMQSRVDAERRQKMEHDPRDFSVGPANASVTVVEYFDYRCPFCMAALPWVMDQVATRHDVRFVFKELPIDQLHGPIAIEASRASIAAMPQGRYLQFHRTMMTFRGELTSERIDQMARQSGVDVARMRRAMNTEAVTDHLLDTRSLAASQLAEEGLATPTFFINGVRVSGFNQPALEAQMRAATREARLRSTAQR